MREIFKRWVDFIDAELLCVQQNEGNVGSEGEVLKLGKMMIKILIEKT